LWYNMFVKINEEHRTYSMGNCNVFHEKLVAIGLSESSSESVIRVLGELLLQNGYVADSYIDAVLEREKEFPTGLPTEPFGVAIPHTDCKHVHRTGIAVGVLSNPVEFGVMGSPEGTVQVRIVFLIAVAEPEGQVKTLQNLALFLHRRDALERLAVAQDAAEVTAILNSEIGTGL